MDQEVKRKQNFLLRLPVSVRENATQAAQDEGTSLNHFISLAVAEKLSRMHVAEQKKQSHSLRSHVVAAGLALHN